MCVGGGGEYMCSIYEDCPAHLGPTGKPCYIVDSVEHLDKGRI